MLRTSKKYHDTYVAPKKNEQMEKLSRLEKIELFDKLTTEAIVAGKTYLTYKKSSNKKEDILSNLAADLGFIRAFYKLVYHYPLLKSALDKNPLTRPDIAENTVTAFYAKLELTVSHNRGVQVSDINHITKLANRYHLDFDRAFNFWLLTDAMRTELKYSSRDTIRFGGVVDRVTAAQLIAIGKKAMLTEEQVRELLPAMGVKVKAACMKNVIEKHKNGLFASNDAFNEAVRSIDPVTENRLGMVAK